MVDNNSHDGEPWPYHEDPNGNMVPCASNPCSLHGGSDVIANNQEETTALKYSNADGTGMTRKTPESFNDDGLKKNDNNSKKKLEEVII